MEKLLTRDEFRNRVFERDGGKCVICGEPADSAHHIIERRLFTSPEELGGYFLNNGASLCETHHRKAETTEISCEEVRAKAGITNIVIPTNFFEDMNYDKWGNVILPNGTRLKGDLFYEESVQNVLRLGNVLDLFVKQVKYPRTWHLPWSTLSKDDRQLKDDSIFRGKNIVMTEKMDGENTTWYNDYYHARSLKSSNHESRNWAKGLWAQKSYLMDENMRICGENCYAVHSIKYRNLKSYFFMFSIWIENECLSWKDTEEYAGILGLETVPVIYRGPYSEEIVKSSFKEYDDARDNNVEGYVIRLEDSFTYGNFRNSMAKFVKPSFRQKVEDSEGHWLSKKIEANELANDRT